MTSLPYRKQRFRDIQKNFEADLVNDLYAEWKIPQEMFEEFKRYIKMFISKAMSFKFVEEDSLFMKNLDLNRENRSNITPNGGVSPKREYQLEYNLLLKSWSEIMIRLTKNNPRFLKKFRLTPNIRIKFGRELEENIGRSLDTALPHSDGWVEGPWGLNCHVPIMGDCINNYLHFYKLKNEKKFSDDFLNRAATYDEMRWVVDHYEDDLLKPKVGYVNISDYVLIHKTQRLPGCGTRISIDTTVMIGDHETHPDRDSEYSNEIPRIGVDLIVGCKLRHGEVENKKTTYSHYTTGNLIHFKLEK